MITLTHNGVDLSTAFGAGNFEINDIKGRGPVHQEADILEVPSKDGGYLRGVRRPVRVIELTVTVKASSNEELRTRVDEISAQLGTKEAVELSFSDETLTYKGVLSGSTDWEDIRKFGRGVLSFVCPDPAKYSGEIYSSFTADEVTVVTEGNEVTLPRFEIDVLQDTTHIDIVRHDGEYMRIGRPASLTDLTYDRSTLILHDPCDDTTPWSTATEVDNGYIAGSIVSRNGAFEADTFGAAITPYAWQGPAIKRSIGEALHNFQVDVKVENLNVGNNTGMIEIYLLDASNNTVAKIGVEDVWPTRDLIQNKFQLGNVDGDRFSHHITADYEPAWNDFDGIIRLWRDDSSGEPRIRPYFGLIDANGQHVWVSSAYLYKDYNLKYQADITQIQVAIRKWPDETESTMRVKDIKVWRLNYDTSGIPYVLFAGDRVTIDHDEGDIRVNGESRTDLKDFGATYFGLQPGTNMVYQFPETRLDSTIYWRNKYK